MRGRQQHFVCLAALMMGALIGYQLPFANLWLSPSYPDEALNGAPNDKNNAPQFRALDPNALDGAPEVIFPRTPIGDTNLPEGCESPVSFMTRSPLVNSAARCLT
jgi:hypothetical protein